MLFDLFGYAKNTSKYWVNNTTKIELWSWFLVWAWKLIEAVNLIKHFKWEWSSTPRHAQMNGQCDKNGLSYEFVFFIWDYSYTETKKWFMFKHVWCFRLKGEKLNPKLRKFNFEQCCQFLINTVINGGILDLLFDKKCSEPASWVLFLYSDCFIVFFIPWTHQYALDQPCLTCCTRK